MVSNYLNILNVCRSAYWSGDQEVEPTETTCLLDDESYRLLNESKLLIAQHRLSLLDVIGQGEVL